MTIELSARAKRTNPFYVMEIGKAAAQLAQQGHAPEMIYLNIGEPDFGAPERVQRAAITAIESGKTQYTQALGLDALRQSISQWYAQRFGLNIEAERIIITAGASAALHLACMALLEQGDEVLMPDPGYPCNQQFVQVTGAEAKRIPVDASSRFQLTAKQVAEQLNEDALKNRYSHLILVADPITLGRIRPLLHKEAQARLLDDLAKIFTNAPLEDIQRALAA